MSAQQSLIVELEAAINIGSAEKRVETLRRVTDLFLNDADRLSEAQIGVFDDALCHLIERIATKALVELRGHLAPVDNSPIEVIRRLARNEEIAVAGPVLTQSARLTTDRGKREIVHRLARNAGARFSESGFTTLVRNAETDERPAEKLGLRLDIPLGVLRDLLLKATEAVRARLLALAPPETKDEVERTLAKISNEVTREATAARDFTQAQQGILLMKKEGRLGESALPEFASRRLYEQMVAALSMLSCASTDLIASLKKGARSHGVLAPCKAAGLKWPTVSAILFGRFAHHTVSEADLARAKEDYLRPSQSSAQRILRFWQVRKTTAREAGGPCRSRAREADAAQDPTGGRVTWRREDVIVVGSRSVSPTGADRMSGAIWGRAITGCRRRSRPLPLRATEMTPSDPTFLILAR